MCEWDIPAWCGHGGATFENYDHCLILLISHVWHVIQLAERNLRNLCTVVNLATPNDFFAWENNVCVSFDCNLLACDIWQSQHDIDLLSLWSWLYITSHSRFLERRVFDASGANIHEIFLSGTHTALASELTDSPTTSRDCSCRSALAECIANTWFGCPKWPQHLIKVLLWVRYVFSLFEIDWKLHILSLR